VAAESEPKSATAGANVRFETLVAHSPVAIVLTDAELVIK